MVVFALGLDVMVGAGVWRFVMAVWWCGVVVWWCVVWSGVMWCDVVYWCVVCWLSFVRSPLSFVVVRYWLCLRVSVVESCLFVFLLSVVECWMSMVSCLSLVFIQQHTR